MRGVIHTMRPGRTAAEGEIPHAYERPGFDGEIRTVLVCSRTGGEQTCELPESITGEALIQQCGLEPEQVKGIFLGWPEGRFVPYVPDSQLRLDCGTVYVLDREECAVAVLSALAADARNSACGRCVFGREGTYQLDLILSDLAAKKGRSADLERLEELCQAMLTQSGCSLGEAAGRAVLSGLALFREEVEAHLVKKICPTLCCNAYVSYYIDPALCNGCQSCVDCCEEEAISGRRGFVHVLDRDSCEKCGECQAVCSAGAIKRQSGGSLRLPLKPVPCGTWK